MGRRAASTPTSNYWAVLVPAMLAVGIGTGLTFVGCTATGMRGVEPRDSGVAAGLLNTSVQCGARWASPRWRPSPRR